MEALELSQKILEIQKRPQFELYAKEVNALVKKCGDHNIKNDATDGQAIDTLSTIKQLSDKLEAERKIIVDPFNQFVKSINGFVKNFTTKLLQGATVLKQKHIIYSAMKEKERREAEAKLQKQADKVQKKVGPDIVVPIPIVKKEEGPTRGETGKVSDRRTWDVEVTDLKALIQAIVDGKIQTEAVEPNLRFLKSLVKAGIREIPGCKVFEKVSLSVYKT